MQAFISESNKHAIQPNGGVWLEQLRDQLGKQDIEVYGLDPRTRAARVMVEADYRMKLVGMGLEKGVPGVQSYLASITLAPGDRAPPMGVLRWWFTLNYDAVSASARSPGVRAAGQGVKVESENEHLTAARPAHPHRPIRGVEPQVRPQLHRAFRRPLPRSTRSMPSCATSSTWPWSARWCTKRAWRTGRLAPELLRQSAGLAVELGECAHGGRHRGRTAASVNGSVILRSVSGGVKVRPGRTGPAPGHRNLPRRLAEPRRSAAVAKKPSGDNWWWD